MNTILLFFLVEGGAALLFFLIYHLEIWYIAFNTGFYQHMPNNGILIDSGNKEIKVWKCDYVDQDGDDEYGEFTKMPKMPFATFSYIFLIVFAFLCLSSIGQTNFKEFAELPSKLALFLSVIVWLFLCAIGGGPFWNTGERAYRVFDKHFRKPLPEDKA